MTTLFIYPHDEKSQGAKCLKETLGARRILHQNSSFVGSKEKKVINWGSGSLPEQVRAATVWNKTAAVNRNANKLEFFQLMKSKNGGRIPEFTTSKDTVVEWLRDKKIVVARTKLQSKAGAGIVFFDKLDEFCKAPLYTVYVKKKEEYRIHFAFGKMIDVQQKVLRKTDDNGNTINPKTIDFRIRNHANGFIFVKNNLHTPDDVIEQAMKCARVSGLDFGACDVVWNETQGRAYVLEINTAPGIEGSTVESYAAAFRSQL